jgi:hypothetical protein
MNRTVIEIDRLIIEGAAIAPHQAKQFARLVESALQQQLEKGVTPSSFSAKNGIQVKIPDPSTGANVNIRNLATNVAQAIHHGMTRKA